MLNKNPVTVKLLLLLYVIVHTTSGYMSMKFVLCDCYIYGKIFINTGWHNKERKTDSACINKNTINIHKYTFFC